MYEINILDKRTGKLLHEGDWEGVVSNLPDTDITLNLSSSTPRFSAKDISVDIHKYRRIDIPSMTFHRHIPKFTNKLFGTSWLNLTTFLTKGTNIIYFIEGDNLKFAHTHDELMTICGIGRSRFYEFYRECLSRSLMAKIKTNVTRYIINPHYAVSGSSVSESLHDLFNKSVNEYEEE